jgi:hypothetical protein
MLGQQKYNRIVEGALVIEAPNFERVPYFAAWPGA